LHARVIVRDGEDVFLGSQSLRRLELDARREVGILVNGAKIASQVVKVFEDDWESSKEAAAPVEKIARKVAKVVSKSMPDMATVLDQVGDKAKVDLVADPDHLEQVVKEAVKNAVRDAVEEAVNEESLT
jgi:phosphatidylserine/phosphatidylglycerophosphate/cardiolipin synthase-like enzyme